MKILHIASSYWPAFERGGPTQSVYLLNKYLVKGGAEVVVYTTHNGAKKETNLDGVQVFYFPYYGYVHYTFSPALFMALGRNAKNFDLIHITGVWNFPVWAAVFWARIYKKPYIISPRGSLMKEPLEKKNSLIKRIYSFLIAKRSVENAAVVHFTAELEKEEYLKTGFSFKKAVVIPNGFEAEKLEITNQDCEDFRKRFKIAPDAKIILSLGRINWKKGFDTLIPAFAKVAEKEPKAILIIAGPDNEGYGQRIKSQISNLKIDDKVVFTGMLIDKQKATAYKISDVFVLPSYSENFGMAVLEAMHFGLPVIITKKVGISPSVEKAGSGVVTEKNEEQIASAIMKILNNSDLAGKMAEAGRKLTETEFSPSGVAKRFLSAYNGIMKDFNNEES